MISLVVEFVAQPGKAMAVRETLQIQAGKSLEHEQACRYFDVCEDPDNPDRFVLYEVYDDEAAVAAHRETPYYQEFRARIDPIVKSREVQMLKRLYERKGL